MKRPRTPLTRRARTMAHVGVRMMFHDRLKLAGTLFGVVFAVLLSNQQLGVFLGLLAKNTMVVDRAGADLWITPGSTETLQTGKAIPLSALHEAEVTPGVAWAAPLLYGGATVSLPEGGTEPVQVIGARAPAFRGGPWNIVAGAREVLLQPDVMIFEDSERAKLGALNIGSVREVNGHRTIVGGFTWGLVPFGPSYAFADYDYARLLLKGASDQTSFVLVGVAPGADPLAVKAALEARMPKQTVFTAAEFRTKILTYVLASTGIGITFGVSTSIGILVGLVIVSLSMFSAVVDNIREFGTLKAIGTTNFELALLLIAQAVVYGTLGSVLGLGLVSQIARAARSPQLALVLPWQLYATTTLVMVFLCTVASMLALLRLRNVEPAMVFR